MMFKKITGQLQKLQHIEISIRRVLEMPESATNLLQRLLNQYCIIRNEGKRSVSSINYTDLALYNHIFQERLRPMSQRTLKTLYLKDPEKRVIDNVSWYPDHIQKLISQDQKQKQMVHHTLNAQSIKFPQPSDDESDREFTPFDSKRIVTSDFLMRLKHDVCMKFGDEAKMVAQDPAQRDQERIPQELFLNTKEQFMAFFDNSQQKNENFNAEIYIIDSRPHFDNDCQTAGECSYLHISMYEEHFVPEEVPVSVQAKPSSTSTLASSWGTQTEFDSQVEESQSGYTRKQLQQQKDYYREKFQTLSEQKSTLQQRNRKLNEELKHQKAETEKLRALLIKAEERQEQANRIKNEASMSKQQIKKGHKGKKSQEAQEKSKHRSIGCIPTANWTPLREQSKGDHPDIVEAKWNDYHLQQ